MEADYKNEVSKVTLSQVYDLEDTITFERDGCSIDVYHYVLDEQ